VYGEDAESVVLRGVKNALETGLRRGLTATAPTTKTKDKVDALIRYDHCITSEQCSAIWFEKPVVMIIIRQLGYRNIGARWVPRILTVEHQTAPKISVHNFSSAVKKMEILFHQE
jgi:hypothetical protein